MCFPIKIVKHNWGELFEKWNEGGEKVEIEHYTSIVIVFMQILGLAGVLVRQFAIVLLCCVGEQNLRYTYDLYFDSAVCVPFLVLFADQISGVYCILSKYIKHRRNWFTDIQN